MSKYCDTCGRGYLNEMLVAQNSSESSPHLDRTANENSDEQQSRRISSHESLLRFLFNTYDTCVFCPGKFVG